jgi:hypothetical protein
MDVQWHPSSHFVVTGGGCLAKSSSNSLVAYWQIRALLANSRNSHPTPRTILERSLHRRCQRRQSQRVLNVIENEAIPDEVAVWIFTTGKLRALVLVFEE